MFDIAWSEFMVVAVVALVVVGPKDLPALLRTVGKTIASLRRMAGEFQGQFNDAMREAELDDLKKEVTGFKDAASRLAGPNPFEIARNELKNALADKPAPSALAGASETAPVAADTPSAFAPQIAPVDQPPAPSPADFGLSAPAVPASENLQPGNPAAASAQASESAETKVPVRKPRTARAAVDKPAKMVRSAAAKPKAPAKAKTTPAEPASEPPSSGAAS